MSTERSLYQTKHIEKKLITIQIAVLSIDDKTYTFMNFFMNLGYFQKEHYDISIGRYATAFSVRK